MTKTFLPLVALMFTLFFSNEMVVAQTYCSAGPDFDWNAGMYIVHAETEGERQTVKISKP